MCKFSHISDVHLGSLNRRLREINVQSFVNALETSENENVDFIIISGDLFDNPYPDISSIRKAIKKMKELRETGISIYAIPGSHDYSINNSSIFDLLESAGLFENVFKYKIENEKITLRPTINKKCNAYIYGISARKRGLEEDYFKLLNGYENADGFRIFVFHSAITELARSTKYFGTEIPVSLVPRGMDYYAGGHIHKKIAKEYDHMKFFYPGPLFGADLTDLEDFARGSERGFFIVEFDSKILNYKFIKNDRYIPLLMNIDVYGVDSLSGYKKVIDEVENFNVKDKIVLLKIWGELISGKTTDINKIKIRDKLMNMGALDVEISFNVTVRKTEKYYNFELTNEEISKNVFRENLSKMKFEREFLDGDKGVSLAMDLKAILSRDQEENEKKDDYIKRIRDEAFKRLGIENDN
ncbi:MAG: metallophosphoesterase family protein [Thermoplasmata archaeon]